MENTKTLTPEFNKIEERFVELSSDGISPGLERTRRLLEIMGDPQNLFKSIHVTGTNGKGSTCAFLSSVLIASGRKTATYTSPHLEHVGERLTINGQMISPEKWNEALKVVEEAIEKDEFLKENRPTYFENFTAASFWLIAREDVDVAIIEVGMGGRLDSTNLLDNVLISVITPIAMDHMEYLGDSIPKIAMEKFAIIKTLGRAIFSGGDDEVNSLFREVCDDKSTKGTLLEDELDVSDVWFDRNRCNFKVTYKHTGLEESYSTKLLGKHQPWNAALAIMTLKLIADVMPVSKQDMSEGIKNTSWVGRMEFVGEKPDVLLDGAHNLHSMQTLAESLKELYGERMIEVIFASMADKDYVSSLEVLANSLNVRLICTEVPGNSRSESASDIAAKAISFPWTNPPIAVQDPMTAFKLAKRLSHGDPIVVCGSLYLVGYLRSRIMDLDE